MNYLITKGAENTNTGLKKTFFYDSARSGMLDFLNNYHGKNLVKLLIPGYIGWSPIEGSGVFDPIATSGIDYEFYELNADLTVNIESFEKLLARESNSITLLIDYFGFSDPNLSKIADLISNANSFLVRDFAHSLVGNFHKDSNPDEGHVRLFSLHKSLPLPAGGAVDYPCGHLVTGQKSTNSELAEQMLSFNFEKIAIARKENYLLMKHFLQNLSCFGKLFTFIRDPMPTDIPHTFPLYVVPECRDQLYEALNFAGIGVVSLYHTLIPEIPSELRNVHNLSKHILNLPIHQDLGRNEIARVVEAFEQNLMRISENL